MKLAIAVSLGGPAPPSLVNAIAAALAALRDDGHSLFLASSSPSRSGQLCDGPHASSDVPEGQQLNCPKTAPVPHFRRALGAALAKSQIGAIPLDPSDGGAVRVRRTSESTGSHHLHPVSSDPKWLDIIAANGGIPLLSNAFYMHSGEICDLDVNMLAAVCATAWKADSLLLFSEHEDPIGRGTGTRWLAADDVPTLISRGDAEPDLQSRLLASVAALEGGVARVRLMPMKCFPLIEDMFVRSLGVGIEVVLGPSPRLRRLFLS